MSNEHINATLACRKFRGNVRLILLVLADSGSSHWVPIPPAKLSIPLVLPGESQSVGYLVLRKDGQRALALAGRRNNGRVTWSGNGDLIDQVSHLLVNLGVLKRQKVPSNGL